MGFLSGLFKSKTKDWYFGHLESNQIPSGETSYQIEPHKAYLNIWLKSMRIVDVRKGLSKFYPVVHSYTSIRQLGTTPAEFNMFTTPTKLQELDSKRLDFVKNFNKRMLGPVPYRGHDVGLEIGLFSIKSDDNLAKPYISLVSDISGLAGVSIVDKALQFADPLVKGINLLTGGHDDSILEIGLSTTLSEPLLKTGYYVVMRAEKEKINSKDFVIDSNDFSLVNKAGKPIKDYPYLVFEIASTAHKGDYDQIPDIATAYTELLDAIRKDDKVEEAHSMFNRVVRTSLDLINDDKDKIIKEINDQIVLPATGGGGAQKTSEEKIKLFKSLSDLKIFG